MTHAYAVKFKTLFLLPLSWKIILITIKMAPPGLSICWVFFPLFLFFSWPSNIHYYDATEMEKVELKVTFHQLLLCAKAYFFLKTPWHFCYGAFFLLSPGEICYSIHLCMCVWVCVYVCVAPVNLTDTFCAWCTI